MQHSPDGLGQRLTAFWLNLEMGRDVLEMKNIQTGTCTHTYSVCMPRIFICNPGKVVASDEERGKKSSCGP